MPVVTPVRPVAVTGDKAPVDCNVPPLVGVRVQTMSPLVFLMMMLFMVTVIVLVDCA